MEENFNDYSNDNITLEMPEILISAMLRSIVARICDPLTTYADNLGYCAMLVLFCEILNMQQNSIFKAFLTRIPYSIANILKKIDSNPEDKTNTLVSLSQKDKDKFQDIMKNVSLITEDE
jgi:hypothetical protein